MKRGGLWIFPSCWGCAPASPPGLAAAVKPVYCAVWRRNYRGRSSSVPPPISAPLRNTPCCENGKLTAPSLSIETLATLEDYVLVEADGSRQLPLKAHDAHEPVIPAVSRQVICVVGASGFGKPIRESVHRPEQFCALTGAAASDPVTPEQAAKAILAEQLCDTMFLNQIDTETQRSLADRFAAALGGSGLRIAAGSLRAGSGWLYPDI